MVQPLLVFSDWGVFVLRIVVGLIMVRHGWPKLKNLKSTGAWFEGVGFKPGIFWAAVAGLIELVGGLALVLGLLTQLAAFFIALEFLVVLLKFRKKTMFSQAVEIDWLIFAAALIIVTLGGGAISFDQFFGLLLY